MGLISFSHQFIIQAVSGFSGGGKHLIEYQNNNDSPFFYYGLNLNHKHLPEIKFHCDLENNPFFFDLSSNREIISFVLYVFILVILIN